MNILTWDHETTTSNKGNPFDQTNRCVSVGWKCNDGQTEDAYYDDMKAQQQFNEAWKAADVVVGFNAKFDLHYNRRLFGLTVEDHQKVYDVQLAWFILTNQQHRFPSLNQVAEYFGLGQKIDVIKEQYWSKGIDTIDIPRDVLTEYLIQDVELTYQCYQCLQDAMPSSKRKLVQLAMMDLVVLQEMEFHGMLYNRGESLELAEQEKKAIADIDKKLIDISGVTGLNYNSGDQLSALLYGGTLVREEKEDYLFTYKDPKKVPVIKQRTVKKELFLPRLVEPLPRSELAKEGFWATNAPTLQSLKAKGKAKQIIDLILERAKREKMVSGYYQGLPDLMDKMNWKDGMIHGQLNQVTAVTGRLSSEKPNIQNLDKNAKKLFYSRYTE